MRTSNYRKKLDKKTVRILTGTLIGTLVVLIFVFFIYFSVSKVEVMGSSHYSEDEIKELVLKGPLAYNSVLAPSLYTREDIEDIPFVEGVEVTRMNRNTICISVKEVKPVGCVPFLDCFMYFDRQGVIVESSAQRDIRVPFFAGLKVDKVVMDEAIMLGDDSVLNTAVSLVRIFEKSEMIPDNIEFDDKYNITLQYGTITAQLGQDKLLEDKMSRLIAILPKLRGQTGILHLENISETSKNITFERELTEEEKAQQEGEEGQMSGEETSGDYVEEDYTQYYDNQDSDEDAIEDGEEESLEGENEEDSSETDEESPEQQSEEDEIDSYEEGDGYGDDIGESGEDTESQYGEESEEESSSEWE